MILPIAILAGLIVACYVQTQFIAPRGINTTGRRPVSAADLALLSWKAPR